MSETAGDTLYRRKELFSTVVDDDLVLFDEAAGKYYTTRGVGTAIWEALETERSFDGLCTHLMAKYEIDRATCERDVAKFLDELVEAEVVERGGAA